METLKKQVKHVLLIGMADKDTKTQTIPTELFKKNIHEVCGDCSIIEGIKGYYTHDNGEEVQEDTLRVEMLFKDTAEVRLMATELKSRLNQESIIYSQEPIYSTLI